VDRETLPAHEHAIQRQGGIQTGSDDARQKSGKPTAQDYARHRSIEKGSSFVGRPLAGQIGVCQY
jgi:hypothetical protein